MRFHRNESIFRVPCASKAPVRSEVSVEVVGEVFWRGRKEFSAVAGGCTVSIRRLHNIRHMHRSASHCEVLVEKLVEAGGGIAIDGDRRRRVCLADFIEGVVVLPAENGSVGRCGFLLQAGGDFRFGIFWDGGQVKFIC